MVLATIVGFFVISAICFFALLAITAVASSGDSSSVKNGSVLYVRLEGALQERSENNLYATLGLAEYEPGLDDILASIKAAKDDDRIMGIFLEPGAAQCGAASLSEIRAALADFRKSGKFVYAYSGAYMQGLYYVSSVADSVFLNPAGSVDWRGLAYQGIFYKHLLEKVGVDMQVVKVGTYKSYTEQFSNDSMSSASREQATVLVNDLWGTISKEVADSRKISTSSLQMAADSMMSFQPADSLMALHMVDCLAYRDEVLNCIRKRLGLKSDAKIPVVTPADYVLQLTPNTNGDEIAVLYAVGEIDNGTTEGINTEKLSKEILKLADDKDVKAVVFRVNSPGGSAYGSEQVWHAMQVLKAKKKVVVSMGDYAASGGYYISCGADAIVANQNTMTGSIGIFGVIPNVGPLAEKVGVDYDVVKTSEGADFPRVFDAMTPVQQKRLQQYVNNGYSLFVKRCADGRKMSTDKLETIAEGRVWSGVKAKEIGLVDQLGTLDDAVALAAKMAKLKDYHTKNYPAKLGYFEMLQESPSLGVKLFLAPKMFDRERQLLDKALKMDVLQAAMPMTVTVE